MCAAHAGLCWTPVVLRLLWLIRPIAPEDLGCLALFLSVLDASHCDCS
jgi:hypothetical protein